eukprot:293525_1
MEPIYPLPSQLLGFLGINSNMFTDLLDRTSHCYKPLNLSELNINRIMRLKQHKNNQCYDEKYKAIRQRTSCNKCIHTQEPFKSSHILLDFITKSLIIIDQHPTKTYPNQYTDILSSALFCKQCIFTLLTTEIFMKRMDESFQQIKIFSEST